MKLYLIQEYQREWLYHKLYQENDPNTLLDTKLCTFHQLFQTAQEKSNLSMIYEAYLLLIHHKQQYPLFEKMLVYKDFIEELLSFYRKCVLYEIDLSKLPEDTPHEKELKKMLLSFQDLDIKEKKIVQQRKQAMEYCLSFEEIIQVFPFAENEFEYQFISDLKEKHPCFHVMENASSNTRIKLVKSNSMRQEIESIFQQIAMIQQDENSDPITSINLICCDYQAQLPLIDQILKRYHAGYNCISYQNQFKCGEIFQSLLTFAFKKDVPSFLQTVKRNAYTKGYCSNHLYPFLEEKLVDISYINDFSTCSTFFESEKEDSLKMSLKIEEYFQKIQEEVNSLLDAKSIKEMILASYEIFMHHPILKKEEELSFAHKIEGFLNESSNLVENFEEFSFFLDLFDLSNQSSSRFENQPIFISDLSHPLEKADYTFVVGCCEDSYPNMPCEKGLFDESYVEKIEGYPSYQDRYEHYFKQLEWLDQSGKQVIYSYYTHTYDGKEKKPSYLIMQKANVEKEEQIEKSPIQLIYQDHRFIPYLHPTVADQLFFKNGKIFSSVSRIERYFACPFSYFMESGLKVRGYQYANLDAATIGSLQHHVFETLVDRHKKQYVDASLDEILEILEQPIEDLKTLYPNQKEFFEFSKHRMANQLLESLKFLKEYELETLFQPTDCEKQFKHPVASRVEIKGQIDRINTFNNDFMIMDYKSSFKSLSPTDFASGLQLQLLTYLVAYQEKTNKHPIGAYYFNMKPMDLNIVNASVGTRGNYEENDLSDQNFLFEQWLSSRRFSGWTFALDDLDDDTFKQFFQPSTRTPKQLYNFEEVKDGLATIYETFQNNLEQGKIPIRPAEGACLYCDYKSTCRFSGIAKNPDKILEDTKQLKGVEEDE